MRVLICFLLAASFVALPAHAQDPPVRITGDGIMLDFQDADLRLVIAALAEAGSLNVIYGELPARRVTLRTTRPVSADALLSLLRGLAAANGLRVTEDADFVRIDAPPTGTQPAQEPGPAQEELRLFVYRLNHARAAQVAVTLQSLFGGRAAPGGSAAGITRPSLSQGLREQAIRPLDPGARAAAPGEMDVPPAAPTVTAALQGLRGQLAGEVHIVPDEATNTLLVRAQAADWEIIEEAVRVVDLRPLQVVIEVVIAEVRRTRDLDVGVSGTITRAGSSGPTRLDLPGAAGSTDAVLRLIRTGSVDVDLALSALATNGEVRILSRPVIHAQHNQEATILVGAERPFVQVFRSLPTDAAVRDQVVQYRDVATSLTILPTINTDGYVNLQVLQEVNTATSETQFGAPVISTRKAATHVLARTGQTVVIGGLIDRQQDRSRTGIPVLSEIPIIGALFGRTRDTNGTSELFLFLTPHIIETDEEADRIRRELERNAPLLRRLPSLEPLVPPAIRLPVIRPDTIRPDTALPAVRPRGSAAPDATRLDPVPLDAVGR